nr:hypothetical protein [Desulfobacula sp.]
MESGKNHDNGLEIIARWESFSEEEKIMAIRDLAGSGPELAIAPVLSGITSSRFAVRNEAKKGLELIRSQVNGFFTDPEQKERVLRGMKTSTSVCYRIYARVRPEMPPGELGYFFKLLLEFEGKGPYFAYMLVYKGIMSPDAMEQTMAGLSDFKRLALIDQYLQAPPGVRFKFGFSFIRLLKSITQREAVIRFYAALFDRQQDADPLLNNISPDLRDTNKIKAVELQSPSPEIKIQGLKALAMLSTEISPDLLMDILSKEKRLKVRSAVYEIIENSSMGVYADLFYPVLEIFYNCGKDEAFKAFKALVVSGKLPLYALLEMVRKTYPSLMPVIYNEISSLSRISFFIIQDIALNKDKYLNVNIDVNLACIFGMIKKRPERVVRILKKYDNIARDPLREEVTGFIEKTKDLLSKEKQSIETEFDSIIQGIRQEPGKNAGIIRSFFRGTIEKNWKC